MQSTLRAFLNIFPEKMKKRTIWYLFDRYLGHFLREKLTLDQLSIDLIDGKGCINDIDLDVDSLNEELSFLPFQFIDGCFIDEISVYVPWSSLLTESCSLEIKGATVICQLNELSEGKSLAESDYLTRSIMSSSMQLAEEIVHEVEEEKFEGLEIFAQLIDSVLRRVELVASNASFILRATSNHNAQKQSRTSEKEEKEEVNKSSSPGSISNEQVSEIEIKVKYLKCEENCQEDDGENKNEDVSVAPKLISKKLTIEDIEILMNGTKVCILEDKHVMEIKVKDSRCDIQVYLASILTAILNKYQIAGLIDMFGGQGECDESGSCQPKGEKTMSPTDYARIEQQLQIDAAKLNKSPANNLTYSMLLRGVSGANAWTSGGGSEAMNNDAQFLPLSDDSCYNGERNYPDKSDSGIKSFHCTVKLPGLVLCLVNSSFDGSEVRINPKSVNMASINGALDKQVDCDHIRCITMPIQIDIGSNFGEIVSGDIWIAEKNHRGLTPLLWSEPKGAKNQTCQLQQQQQQQHLLQKSISFQCDINRERIKMLSKNVTNLILDPTLLERIDNFFPISDSTTSSSEYQIIFNCASLKGKLLFPVADLRNDTRQSYSEVRPHWLNFDATDVSFNTNLSTYEITMEQLRVNLSDSSGSHEIGKVFSQGSDLIRINVKRGPNTSILVENEEMVNTVLTEVDMEESIHICSSDTKEIGPFQTKRKVIKSTKDDDEQVVTPNDQETSIKYFETCQSVTQLQIEASAPLIEIVIESKDQLDILYNGFGNDLALWKPIKQSSPSSSSSTAISELPDSNGTSVNPVSIMSSKSQAYFACKSGLGESIDSDSSFHSAGGSINNRVQNFMTSLIRSDQVKISIGDRFCNHVIQSSDVFLGLTVGLEEDTCNVFSIHGNNVSWSFNDETVISSNYFLGSTSALSLTFEINTKELPVSKRIKFAVQLTDAALFKTELNVFTDIWKYIDLTNDPVLGYIPPKTLTELHISVLNGSIVYNYGLPSTRPALFTIDGAYATAMMVENTSETLLRFIIEEAALYFKKNSLSSKCLKNYVCIVDSGLIDLNLKLSDEGKIDFKACNNIINIRACNDSLTALVQLIVSLVNNGSNGDVNEKTDDDELPSYVSAVSELQAESLKHNGAASDTMREVLNGDLTEIFEFEREPPKKTVNGKGKSGKKENSKKNAKAAEMMDSGFWILGDDDVGAGIKATAEPTIRALVNEPIKVIDNYFGVTKSRPLPEIMESVVGRYLLEEMTLVISIYGGRDFEDEPKKEEEDLEKKEKGREKECEIEFDCWRNNEPKVRFMENSIHLWESIDFKNGPNFFQNEGGSSIIPSNCKSMGGRFRQNDVCVQLYLSKMKSVFDKFDENCPTSWRFVFMVNEIEIRDRVSRSNINKMLYEYTSENMPRRNFANMIYIRATTFRNPIDKFEECDLKVSIKPLRVNIDQDTIMFLMEFFGTLKCLTEMVEKNSEPTESCSSSPDNPSFDSGSPIIPCSSNSRQNVNDGDTESLASECSEDRIGNARASSLFVKSFLFSPDVPIRLDYHGKRVDFEQGALPGLLMGLAHLNQSELLLKKLHQKRGILGLDRVLSYALMEWFEDIKRHQLPSIIGSIGPMNSVRQLIQGLIDLVWIPVDQYRRDRRIVRGLQRGASSFSSSTAMAVIDLANRLVHVIQGTAQFAHDVVSSSSPRSPQHNVRGFVPTSQPRDLREGVATAYTVMREGFNQTYRNVANAGLQAEGYSDAVGGLIRQIPSNIFQPIIKVSEATSNVLVGMRNQLTPEARKDDQDKWKS